MSTDLPPDDDLDSLIEGLLHDEETAAAELVRRFGDPLRRIADRRLGGPLRRRVDADDVLQSAFRTFFRRTREGRLKLDDAARLWNLLCAITLTKVRQHARFHGRRRRAVNRESPGPVSSTSHRPEPKLSGRIFFEGVDFADHFRQLLDVLDDDERRVVLLKLEERTSREIAAELGTSERTVRRMLARVRARLEPLLTQSD